jgi:hypothetical protein
MKKTAIKQAIELLEKQRDSLQELNSSGVLLKNELNHKSNQINTTQLLLYRLLYVEKKQMIDFHVETMKAGLIEEGNRKWIDLYEPKIREIAERCFSETFGNTVNADDNL